MEDLILAIGGCSGRDVDKFSAFDATSLMEGCAALWAERGLWCEPGWAPLAQQPSTLPYSVSEQQVEGVQVNLEGVVLEEQRGVYKRVVAISEPGAVLVGGMEVACIQQSSLLGASKAKKPGGSRVVRDAQIDLRRTSAFAVAPAAAQMLLQV
jgi:hypothetical protein